MMMGHHKVKMSELRPFGLPWLDSSYQETLLPNAPWHQVHRMLCDSLAEKIESHLSNEKRRQMIFEMVGPHFALKYFPQFDNDAQLLEPPHLSAEGRQKVYYETSNWLKVAMHQTTADVQCQRPEVMQDEDEDVAVEMEDFLHHTKSVISKGMERHLYLQEDVLVKKNRRKLDAIEHIREDKEMWEKWQKAERKRWETTHIKGILKNPLTRPPAFKSGLDDAPAKPPPTPQIQADIYVPDSQPPLWGYQAESLGRSLVAILKRDPGRFAEIAWRLHGRQLPSTLRIYIWRDVLLMSNREEHRGTDVNVEKVVREQFGRMVVRGLGEMRIKNPMRSPISSLINKSLKEVYDQTPGMYAYQVDGHHMRDATKALNVLHCFDRSYAPYLVYRLFPLQLAFHEQSGESEQPHELALYLHLLQHACFPKWPEVFSLAERVIELLQVADEELLSHLTTISCINATLDTKNLMSELLPEEHSKAEVLTKKRRAGSTNGAGEGAVLLSTDPLSYLQKWIGEGFVGVLDTPAIVWVWDQLFMEKWNSKVIIDVCLALLLLLKDLFLEATDHASMAQVFQREPCKLYTKDIQRAWMHLQYGGHPDEVPPFNRRILRSPAAAAIEPVGVKAVVVYLVFSAKTLRKFRWLDGFDPEQVKLVFSVYIGSTLLLSQTCVEPAKCPLGARPLADGRTAYKLYFLKTVFEFSDLDPTKLAGEQAVPVQPQALVQVEYYGHEDTKAGRVEPVSLGKARLQLYAIQSAGANGEESGAALLVVKEGEQQLCLSPQPEVDMQHGSPVSVTDPVYIESDSVLWGSVFNLRLKPPPSPIPSPLPRHMSSLSQADPERPTIDDKFDLHIDCVENIPDNATVCKITGRLVKMGTLSGIPDILALPVVTLRARSPSFDFRLVINEDKMSAEKEMLALLRVYTVDKNSKNPKSLCIIGSCLFGFFNSDGDVRVGAHRCPLRTGIPDLSKGIKVLNPRSLEGEPRIPACAIKLRLSKHTQKAERPLDGLEYRFDGECFNESEERVMQSYATDDGVAEAHAKRSHEPAEEKDASIYPRTVSDMVDKLKKMESDTSGDSPRLWIEKRLNQKTHLLTNQPAESLPLPLMVEYRMATGITVQVTGAHGLPKGRYVQALVWVSPGNAAARKEPAPEGHRKYQFYTSSHDYEARQTAPVWLDEPMTIHPHPDAYNCLVIQLVGLRVVYHPTKDHDTPGTVTDTAGLPVAMDETSSIGWAIVPLMQRSAVWSGRWRVPILCGPPSNQLLSELRVKSVKAVFQQHKWTPQETLEGASLDVNVWDAHFMPAKHLPQGFKEQDLLIDLVDVADQCSFARRDTSGRLLSQIVLDSLGKKYNVLGMKSVIYQQEKEFFTQVMEETFRNIMNEMIEQVDPQAMSSLAKE